ncbi:MAG: polymer-forming cytoskeletal protein [Gammaproteobacteria bacterium]|nr:MAG: polymer-forming cytoskeletal protein [Gammaproteobacteria bacterium]
MGERKKRRLLDAMGEPATIIGPGAEFHGHLRCTGHLLVLGTVVGDCDADGSVTLAEGGSWTGLLSGIDLIIAGSVDGDVVAGDRIEIRPGAQISGSVTASRIAIAAGAIVDGELRSTAGAGVHRFEEKRRTDA